MRTTADDGVARLSEAKTTLALFRADPAAVSDDDLRELRRLARSAIDRLDDEPEFDDAHEMLDQVGNFVRTNRPVLCSYTPDGEDYKQECPVALGHIRAGMSVGAIIDESECSICGQDPWICPHIPGRTYDGEDAVRIITKATFLEVSFVDRPDMPDARIMSSPVSRSDVEAVFGGPLPANAFPVCNRCLSPCDGVRERPSR